MLKMVRFLNYIFLITILSIACTYNKKELPKPELSSQNNSSITNTKHTVDVGMMTFNPSSLAIAVGDTVEWKNTSGFHNVNGTQLTFPSNPESFGNNVSSSWTFIYVFTIAGNYNYQCDVHVSSGMTGSIVVQ